MIVSSTEFQQNVGKYLKLADSGEQIEIIKKKPANVSYKLVRERQKPTRMNKSRMERLITLAKSYNIRTDEDGLSLQRRVRS